MIFSAIFIVCLPGTLFIKKLCRNSYCHGSIGRPAEKSFARGCTVTLGELYNRISLNGIRDAKELQGYRVSVADRRQRMRIYYAMIFRCFCEPSRRCFISSCAAFNIQRTWHRGILATVLWHRGTNEPPVFRPRVPRRRVRPANSGTEKRPKKRQK